MFKFGSSGTGNGEFGLLAAITTDNTGNIIVVEGPSNNRVQVFDPNGQFLFTFATFGSADGELDFPLGVATNSQNDIIVIDNGNARVQIFNSSGEFQSKFGTRGFGDGGFTYPLGLTVDSQDRIIVGDAGVIGYKYLILREAFFLKLALLAQVMAN